MNVWTQKKISSIIPINAEMQWNNIKECVLDTLGDLVGKVEKRTMDYTGNDQENG